MHLQLLMRMHSWLSCFGEKAYCTTAVQLKTASVLQTINIALDHIGNREENELL